MRFLNTHLRENHYFHPPKTNCNDAVVKEFDNYRVVCFPDAAFSKLQGEHIIESNVIASANALYRAGAIRRRGYFIYRMCAEIQRVRRSKLSAESRATVTAGDYSIWGQVILIELSIRKYDIHQSRPPTDSPLLCHFSKHPTDMRHNEKITKTRNALEFGLP